MNVCEWCSAPCVNRFCSRKCSATKQHRSVPVEGRFWDFVAKGEGCWEWQAARDRGGYGVFSVTGKQVRAHRLAFKLSTGIDPGEAMVLHRCDNPPCVRPDHLWLGDAKANANDAAVKGRTARGDRNGARLYPERLRRGPMPYRDPATRPRGSGHSNAKLTEEQVIEIRKLVGEGRTQRSVAVMFKVSPATICLAVSGINWAHVSSPKATESAEGPASGSARPK